MAGFIAEDDYMRYIDIIGKYDTNVYIIQFLRLQCKAFTDSAKKIRENLPFRKRFSLKIKVPVFPV